jgi:hypothetical protein
MPSAIDPSRNAASRFFFEAERSSRFARAELSTCRKRSFGNLNSDAGSFAVGTHCRLRSSTSSPTHDSGGPPSLIELAQAQLLDAVCRPADEPGKFATRGGLTV